MYNYGGTGSNGASFMIVVKEIAVDVRQEIFVAGVRFTSKYNRVFTSMNICQ